MTQRTEVLRTGFVTAMGAAVPASFAALVIAASCGQGHRLAGDLAVVAMTLSAVALWFDRLSTWRRRCDH